MRTTKTLGLAVLTLAATGWIAIAQAQAPAPTAAPASPAAPAAPSAAPTAPTASPSAPDATPAPAAEAPAPAPDASAPAAEAPAKKPLHHHKMHHASKKLAPTKAGDAAVEDLNAKSLDAAKSGTPFTPPK